MTVTTLAEKRAELDLSQDLPYALLQADDTITLILYKPQSPDQQQPHDQDEYYFVASGSGEVTIAGVKTSITTGDAIFVPALTEHAFSNTSSDFACWGLFFGSKKSGD